MKIITAHIKKACAEKRIIMEKIKKNVSNIKIKDPGSAITHFIGAIFSLGASSPLLIKAAQTHQPVNIIAMIIYSISLVALYSASTAYHTIPA